MPFAVHAFPPFRARAHGIIKEVAIFLHESLGLGTCRTGGLGSSGVLDVSDEVLMAQNAPAPQVLARAHFAPSQARQCGSSQRTIIRIHKVPRQQARPRLEMPRLPAKKRLEKPITVVMPEKNTARPVVACT
jgi:hypothetical protein